MVENGGEDPLPGSGAGARATGMATVLMERAPMARKVRADLENMMMRCVVRERTDNDGTRAEV